MVKCPRCKGVLFQEDGHLHCASCARSFKLVSFRYGEKKRLELITASRLFDKVGYSASSIEHDV